MDHFKLYNGVEIPAIGYGTYRSMLERDENVIIDAIKAGYRHIDTAARYKTEPGIGKAIKACGINRSDFFITTKIWTDDLGYDSTLKAIETSLENLQMDYLDLYLIHWPINYGDHEAGWVDDVWKEPVVQTWKAMERAYEEGILKAIGTSNFLPHHLEVLFAKGNIKPMVDQLEYHPGYTQQYAVDFCKSNDILVEAWSPLGRSRVLNDSFILALAKKYNVSAAQVCLRFAYQNGIVTLPKASSIERMLQNKDIFNFEINREDMHRLSTLSPLGWSGEHPDFKRVQI